MTSSDHPLGTASRAGPGTAGALIKAVRRRQGLTQTELAKRAGISQPVVSAYERGRRDPTLSTLRKLVEASGERLRVDAVPAPSEIPPAQTLDEHGRRLVDVLSLADAVPTARRDPLLSAPRLVSR